MEIERRRFIRHPLTYPIKTRILEAPGGLSGLELASLSEDIGAGGLLFHCGKAVPVGTEVEIEVRVEHRVFTLGGKVVRSESAGGGKHGIAVAFTTPSDILKVRMMEQIVRIELFKTRLERRYGVGLDFAPVAKEWIRRYSKAFAEHFKT